MAIDSRIEMFPVEVWDAYERVAAGADGWESQLEAWGVTIAVAGADDPGLSGRLLSAGWRQTYEDADGSILLAPAR